MAVKIPKGITPYFSTNNGFLVHGYCSEVLQGLEDGCVDLVLTDPPYKGLKGKMDVTFDSGVGIRRNTKKTVGDLWAANLDWFKEAWRVTTYGLMSFCSFHFVGELQAQCPSKTIGLITWYQRNAMPSMCNAPHFQTEFIWLFKKVPGLKWKTLKTFYDYPRLQPGCMAKERLVDRVGKALHPAQKPIKLIYNLLSVGGESVLDPFAGTGTTLVACEKLNRKWIGVEKDENYCEIAAQRIEQEARQLKLFS